jgi:hypothetical protein
VHLILTDYFCSTSTTGLAIGNISTRAAYGFIFYYFVISKQHHLVALLLIASLVGFSSLFSLSDFMVLEKV